MTEQYAPTTGEVRELIAEARSRGWQNKLRGAQYVLTIRPADALESVRAERDAALARIAKVAAKAWDEGRAAEKLAWEHAFDGHPVPEGEVCDECAVVNPYRKAVQSDD